MNGTTCKINNANFNGSHLVVVQTNGYFIISRIRVKGYIIRDVNVIEESQLEGWKAGVEDYIVKPFNLSFLKARIHNIQEKGIWLKKKYSKELYLVPKTLRFQMTVKNS